MSRSLLAFCIVFFAAALLNAVVAVVAVRRRKNRVGMAFLGMIVCSAFWAFVQASEALSTTLAAKVLWSQFEYVAVAGAPFFFLLFALRYSRSEKGLSYSRLIAISILPVAIVVMAFTNSFHHFLWTGFSFDSPGTNVLSYHHGPGFWIANAWAYGSSLFAAVLFIRMYSGSARLIRRQILSILAGALFPAATGLVYLVGWPPLAGMDPTCLGFTATSLIGFWSLGRFSLLNLVPVGRAVLVENIPDGILVIDLKGLIVDINPSAVRLFAFGRDRAPAVGEDIGGLLSGRPALASLLSGTGEAHGEILLELDSPRWFDATVLPLTDRRAVVHGRLLVLRDVTERTLAAQAQRRIIEQLQAALSEIKQLSGLLPICSVCKKVRDDVGYWKEIEAYVAEHSEADFTHSLCPDCTHKMYGEYMDDCQTRKE